MNDNAEAVDGSHSDATKFHDDEGIKFTPPLYEQRYRRVFDILTESNVSSLADFGCAECRSLRLLKDLPSLERLIGVDIDKQLLLNNSYRVTPLIADYLFRRPKRLTVQLLCGSLLEWDDRLKNIDAVVMIEVIEHLVAEDVEKLPAALFGVVRPELVIITTPNAEFNVLFTELVGFRHPDHKFEWTRNQFSEWCDDVGRRYGYSVQYDGVGDPPTESKHVGSCSQIAIFRRLDDGDKDQQCRSKQSADCQPYEQVYESEYPEMIVSTLTLDERILNEANYYIRLIARSSAYSGSDESVVSSSPDTSDFSMHDASEQQHSDSGVMSSSQAYDYDDGQCLQIRLSDLLLYPTVQQICNADHNKLREVLEAAGHELTADKSTIIYRCAEDSRNVFSLGDFLTADDDDQCLESSKNITSETDLHLHDCDMSKDESWD